MPGPVQQVPIAPGTPAFDPAQAGQQAFFNASLAAATPAPPPIAVGPTTAPQIGNAPQQIPIAAGTPAFDPTQAGAQLYNQFAQPVAPAISTPINTNPFLREQLVRNEEQEKLEQEHGRFATFATQAARGALNVVLLAPALIGAGLEGAGKLTGWQGLEHFGRDYGEASNGREALATLFNGSGVEATKAVFGGGDRQKALESYEGARRTVEEQAEAWPLLSTVSRIAGGAAVSFGIAGLASAGAAAAGGAEGAAAEAGAAEAGGEGLTLGQVLLRTGRAGFLEGAEGGAQSAYETSRPYRDVVGSTLMGGLMGAGTAMAAGGIAYKLEHSNPVEALHDYARQRTFKAIGGIQSDIKKVGGLEDADRIADDIWHATLSDGESVIPKSITGAARISPEEIRERIAQGAEEYGAKLGDMQRQVGVFLDEHARDALPKGAIIRDKLAELAEPLEQSSQLKSQGAMVRGLIDDIDKATRDDGTISLSDLIRIKRQNYQAIAPTGDAPPAAKEALDRAGGILSSYIADVADAGAVKMGAAEAGAYKELNRITRSFIQADQVANRANMRLWGNRKISLTDTMVGATAFGADLAGGGGLVSAAKGFGTALVHKYARERGSQIMAALAEKLADTPNFLRGTLEKAANYVDKTGELGIGTEAEILGASAEEANAADKIGVVGGTLGGSLLRDLGWKENRDAQIVSIRDAGGREAQSVIAELGRAKARVEKEVNAAGDNPEQRQFAQQQAQERLSTALAMKAGPYNAAEWQSDPPKPLQKVLHRSELLDATSKDIAAAAQTAAVSKPQAVALELNADKVRKLTKDADGPLAIGGVQQALKQTLSQTNSPLVHGVAMRTLSQLSTTDTAETMIAGHTFLQELQRLYGNSDASTRADLTIASNIVQRSLSDTAFGKAGAAYAALNTPADDATKQLLNPDVVRDALRNLTQPGQMANVLASFKQSLDAAQRAAAALTSTKAPSQPTKDLEKVVSKAEQALLLDGGPAGRVFDFFKPGQGVATPNNAPQTTVLNAVKPQIQKMLPMLGKSDGLERYDGSRPQQTVRALPKSQGDLKALYAERMQDLADAVNKPPQNAPGLPPGISAQAATAITTEAQQRLQQLYADLPKPRPDIRGGKFVGLSSQDLRRADAMYEATVAPMSIFEDFRNGNVDYQKVQYVWRQYPGLQQAAQAGLLDTIHTQLSDEERAALPDSTLTQLDYLLGFGGKLQPSVDPAFAARMSAAGAQEEQQRPSPPQGQLETPASKPTYTERLAGARART